MSNSLPLATLKQLTKFDKGLGALLPEAYKKFYKEWQLTEPTAVHYIPAEGKYRRNEVTGEVTPIQNIPIPLRFPKEHHEHIWGGEGIIQGFKKKGEMKSRVPHFWIPTLRRSVVYSEVLDKHISVVVTDRTINLINANYGFDHYLLKTLACDLKSLLPLRLKRKILQELSNSCPSYLNDPVKKSEVLQRYTPYLSSYTPEEIEWYGYSFEEACGKMKKMLEEKNNPVPLKHVLRARFLEKLKDAQTEGELQTAEASSGSSSSWMQSINPFGKKREA